MDRVLIRPAAAKDAKGILQAHYSAVHDMSAADYPSDILALWSPKVTPERVMTYIQTALPAETTLVAVVDDEIAGFGAIVESLNELRAVYVSSKYGGRGVGTALLMELERLAKERGCSELHMDSSLTAERFYSKHGYKVLDRGFHTLSSGPKMACVKMRKSLKR